MIFENGRYSADQVYFDESDSNKSVNLAARARGACATKFANMYCTVPIHCELVCFHADFFNSVGQDFFKIETPLPCVMESEKKR